MGEVAHIAGEHDGKGGTRPSARYDPHMTDEERNGYGNLIYLCGTCHTRIDVIPQGELDYPTQILHRIKVDHEQTVRQTMLDAFSHVGFPELEEATRWATTIQPHEVTCDYSIVRVEDKIAKNALGPTSRSVIVTSLSIASSVSHYIQSMAQTDPDFPERLIAGFLEEYYRLKRQGLRGDDLFELMCRFAQRGLDRQAYRAAAVAVLVYLFESCEVFEK